VPRPALEVADVFRTRGPAWRRANTGHVSLGQLKVMSAIESCRTAALGGHVARCEKCRHTLIAYNSCRNRHCPKCQGLAAGGLQFVGDHVRLVERSAFTAYLAPLRKAEWVVYSKRPFGGPEAVLAYLSLYTHRIAISNSRLIAFDDSGVTFTWKDYRAEGRDRAKVMTLATDEFIRRFLIHVLPDGFHRIRYYALFNAPAPHVEPADGNGTADAEPQTLSHPCPCCGGRMIIIETFERGCTPRFRPSVHNPIDSS
jgi:hypothetical protein